MYLHTCRVGNKLSQVWNPRRLESSVTSCPRSSIAISYQNMSAAPISQTCPTPYTVYRLGVLQCTVTWTEGHDPVG